MADKAEKKKIRFGRLAKLEANNRVLSEKIDELSSKLELMSSSLETALTSINNNLREQKEYISLESLSLEKKSKILICGFYGARNLGDELMLQSLLEYFDKKKIKVTILLSNNYDLDCSFYAPHDVIHCPKRSADLLAIANNFDTIIWGGGAHIDDDKYYFSGEFTQLAYVMNKISRIAIERGKKVIVLGVSSNKTVENLEFIDDLQFIINNATYFSLRDSNSLKTLKESGLDIRKVKIVDDIALHNLHIKKKTTQNNKITIGIVYILTDETKEVLMEYTDSLIKLLKNEYDDKKFELLLIPFYDYRNNDEKLYDELNINLQCNNITVSRLKYVNSKDKIEELLNSLDLVISMRYHATLLAGYFGVPTISLDFSKSHKHYFNKIKSVEEKFGENILSFDFGESVENFVEVIKKALKMKRKTLPRKIIDCIDDLDNLLEVD